MMVILRLLVTVMWVGGFKYHFAYFTVLTGSLCPLQMSKLLIAGVPSGAHLERLAGPAFRHPPPPPAHSPLR